jgi:hypothetical protein
MIIVTGRKDHQNTLSLMEYVKYNFGYIILRMELEERDALK